MRVLQIPPSPFPYMGPQAIKHELDPSISTDPIPKWSPQWAPKKGSHSNSMRPSSHTGSNPFLI